MTYVDLCVAMQMVRRITIECDLVEVIYCISYEKRGLSFWVEKVKCQCSRGLTHNSRRLEMCHG